MLRQSQSAGQFGLLFQDFHQGLLGTCSHSVIIMEERWWVVTTFMILYEVSHI